MEVVMDNLKDKIEEIVNKIKSDPNFKDNFQKEPVKALESVIELDLPDDKINEIINLIKTKIKLDDNQVINKIKGLFD